MYYYSSEEECSTCDDNEDNSYINLTILPTPTNFTLYLGSDNNLWDGLNVSETLEKTTYLTDITIEEVIEFYSNESNIQNFTIKSSKVAATPEDPFNVSFGSVKLEYNNTGIYIVARSLNESLALDAEIIVGFAYGDWIYIEGCGEQN
jgi:hypothetical protein